MSELPPLVTDIQPLFALMIESMPLRGERVQQAALWMRDNTAALGNLGEDAYPALSEAYPDLNIREQLCAVATYASLPREFRTSASGVPIVRRVV